MQLLRAQWPPESHAKSTGQASLTGVQAVGAQWWLAPQLSPAAQSPSVWHPGWHALVHTQGNGSQTEGRHRRQRRNRGRSRKRSWEGYRSHRSPGRERRRTGRWTHSRTTAGTAHPNSVRRRIPRSRRLRRSCRPFRRGRPCRGRLRRPRRSRPRPGTRPYGCRRSHPCRQQAPPRRHRCRCRCPVHFCRPCRRLRASEDCNQSRERWPPTRRTKPNACPPGYSNS